MKSWTIFIPEFLTPGLNEWQRMHWRARAIWIKRCSEHIVAYSDGLVRFAGKVKVGIQRNRRSGPDMDQDNAAASAKCILDSLKKLEVIEDDSPAHVQLEVRQELVGHSGDWGTLICIEQLNGATT